MAIGYSPEQKEINFHRVDFTDPLVVKGLLRFYYKFREEAYKKFNWELITILIDLKEALDNIVLTPKQTDVLLLYAEGLSEEEIGNLTGVTKEMVNQRLSAIGKKLMKCLN